MARIGLAMAGLGVAALLTACSGSDSGGSDGGSSFADESADDIVAAAKADMGDLTAVKVSGDITTDGQTVSLDLQTNADGDCTGSIGIDDGSAELLGVGGQIWMKPDGTFWKSFAGSTADQIISLVGAKWVVFPADSGDSFAEFCNVDSLMDQLLKSEDDGSTYSVNGTDTLDGADVVKVDNEDKQGEVSTGYVLVDDPHYLVKIEKTSGADSGLVTFSEFDTEFTVEAPPESDVIDLNSLGS